MFQEPFFPINSSNLLFLDKLGAKPILLKGGKSLVMNTSYLSRFVLKSVLISCSNRVATTSRRTLSVGVSNPFSTVKASSNTTNGPTEKEQFSVTNLLSSRRIESFKSCLEGADSSPFDLLNSTVAA
jgi:hypothetical protein